MVEFEYCRVYWGSHGCDLWRGHVGPHICLTCWDEDGDNEGYVGSWPYYGPDTNFYGEDAEGDGRWSGLTTAEATKRLEALVRDAADRMGRAEGS